MNEQQISVIIADRPYRLRVKTEDEEALFRQAGEIINKRIGEYARNFAFRDQRDLLAMVVLQFTVDYLKCRKSIDYHDELHGKLQHLDQLLDQYLEK